MADHFRPSRGYGKGNNNWNNNSKREDKLTKVVAPTRVTMRPSPPHEQGVISTSSMTRSPLPPTSSASMMLTTRPPRERREQQEQQFETSTQEFHPNNNNNNNVDDDYNESAATDATTANNVFTTTNSNLGNSNVAINQRGNNVWRRNVFESGTRNSLSEDNAEDDEEEGNYAEEDDNGDRARLVNMNNLVEDETGRRPNKLFPYKNEKDKILRRVRSVLNKVSSTNYHRQRKRWLIMMPNGDDDDQGLRLGMEQMSEVLQLVIAKAMDDTIYMHIYAGMMGYVVGRLQPEISSKIRQLTNAQLHHELQKLTTDKELALFDRCTERVDATRRKKVTLHRFIAELYGEKACTSKFLYERVRDLLIVRNPSDIDENIECLCVLMTFAGQKLEEVKKDWVEDIFKKLSQRQTETPQMVSKRIQFMILDLVEMRGNGWSPHNKWWSPSVQIAPQENRRERISSSPGAVVTTSNNTSSNVTLTANTERPENLHQEEPPHKLQRKHQVNIHNSRSRSVSEGSGNPTVSSAKSATSTKVRAEEVLLLQQNTQQLQQPKAQEEPRVQVSQVVRRKRELTANQSRALMALLNKVSPYNLDRIAYQLYEVLNEETMEEAVNFIVDKILDDSFYTRTHAVLIKRVSNKPNMKNFGLKIGSRVMKILEKNPDSKDGFQFLAELYNLNLVSMHQVITALEWLMNCSSPGMISSSVESLVIFLFIAGAKLEADVRDELWINRLIELWEKKANLVAHNQGRPMCLMRDLIELRQNKWAPVRQPHWIPPTIDLPTIRFEPESLIRLFQSDRMEFLRFVKGETSTLSRIERFSKEALEYAVRHGNHERDPEFLKMTGVCLRVLIHERLLKRGRLENYLGTFVSKVVTMKRRNSKAWDNLGLIMNEVY